MESRNITKPATNEQNQTTFFEERKVKESFEEDEKDAEDEFDFIRSTN